MALAVKERTHLLCRKRKRHRSHYGSLLIGRDPMSVAAGIAYKHGCLPLASRWAADRLCGKSGYKVILFVAFPFVSACLLYWGAVYASTAIPSGESLKPWAGLFIRRLGGARVSRLGSGPHDRKSVRKSGRFTANKWFSGPPDSRGFPDACASAFCANRHAAVGSAGHRALDAKRQRKGRNCCDGGHAHPRGHARGFTECDGGWAGRLMAAQATWVASSGVPQTRNGGRMENAVQVSGPRLPVPDGTTRRFERHDGSSPRIVGPRSQWPPSHARRATSNQAATAGRHRYRGAPTGLEAL